MLAVACKESGDLMAGGKLSALNINNATADILNVYQNGARLNNNSPIYPGGQTGYTSITANSTSFEVKINGSANYLIGNFPVKLDTNRNYSLFIAGETADKLFITDDTHPRDSTNTVAVRFVNASPSSINFDATVDKLSFSNVVFAKPTSFQYDTVSVSKADTILVTVYMHGSATKLKSVKMPVFINSVLTLYLQGLPTGTGADTLAIKSNVN